MNNQHGGKRVGAGRPPKEGIARKVNIRLSLDQWKEIKKMQKENYSLTAIVSHLVTIALKKNNKEKENENEYKDV